MTQLSAKFQNNIHNTALSLFHFRSEKMVSLTIKVRFRFVNDRIPTEDRCVTMLPYCMLNKIGRGEGCIFARRQQSWLHVQFKLFCIQETTKTGESFGGGGGCSPQPLVTTACTGVCLFCCYRYKNRCTSSTILTRNLGWCSHRGNTCTWKYDMFPWSHQIDCN